jgi:hypothetical protein
MKKELFGTELKPDNKRSTAGRHVDSGWFLRILQGDMDCRNGAGGMACHT